MSFSPTHSRTLRSTVRPYDSDGDGLCDATDTCPNIVGQIGSSCDDGNMCTINDVLNSGCQCTGTFQDSDGDGTCDANDNCPSLAGLIVSTTQ